MRMDHEVPSPSSTGTPAAADANGGPSATDTAAVLRARARELSRAADDPTAAGERLDVVEFRIAGERYGVESSSIREAYPLRDLTPVPCTPAFVLGIVNVRGRVLTVIDVRTFFGLPAAGLTDLNKVLILHAAGIEVGVLADAVVGVRSVRADAVQSSLPTLTGVRADYLRGVTDDGMVILDAGRLLADEKLVVHEDVPA